MEMLPKHLSFSFFPLLFFVGNPMVANKIRRGEIVSSQIWLSHGSGSRSERSEKMARSRFPFFLAFVGPSGFSRGVFSLLPLRSILGGRNAEIVMSKGVGMGEWKSERERAKKVCNVSQFLLG